MQSEKEDIERRPNPIYTEPFIKVLQEKFHTAFHKNEILSYFENPHEAQTLHNLATPIYWGFGCGFIAFGTLRGGPQRIKQFYQNRVMKRSASNLMFANSLKASLVDNSATQILLDFSLSLWAGTMITTFLSLSESRPPSLPITRNFSTSNKNDLTSENEKCLTDTNWYISKIPLIPGRSKVSDELCDEFIHIFDQLPKEIQINLNYYPPIPSSQTNSSSPYTDSSISPMNQIRGSYNLAKNDATNTSPKIRNSKQSNDDKAIDVNSTMGMIANFVYSCKARKAHEAHLRKSWGVGSRTPVSIEKDGVKFLPSFFKEIRDKNDEIQFDNFPKEYFDVGN